jgi:hypothetical protein
VPLFDDTAMRTPMPRSSSSARRVSAGMRMAPQRAGFFPSNSVDAAALRGSPGKISSSCFTNGSPQVAR